MPEKKGGIVHKKAKYVQRGFPFPDNTPYVPMKKEIGTDFYLFSLSRIPLNILGLLTGLRFQTPYRCSGRIHSH